METSSSRRTGKKLRDTHSWRGDDFGHGWHFRKGRLGGVGVRGKDHTDSMRRLHDKAVVAAGLVEDDNNFHLDNVEAGELVYVNTWIDDYELDMGYSDSDDYTFDPFDD